MLNQFKSINLWGGSLRISIVCLPSLTGWQTGRHCAEKNVLGPSPPHTQLSNQSTVKSTVKINNSIIGCTIWSQQFAQFWSFRIVTVAKNNNGVFYTFRSIFCVLRADFVFCFRGVMTRFVDVWCSLGWYVVIDSIPRAIMRHICEMVERQSIKNWSFLPVSRTIYCNTAIRAAFAI